MFRVAKHLMKVVKGDTVDVSETNGVRSLHLGSNTIQSAMKIRDPNALELTYTRGMMCFLLFNPQVKNVLSIGLGGGSIAKYIHTYCPELATTVVEINPKVIQVARSQFYVPENDERLEVIEGDGCNIWQTIQKAPTYCFQMRLTATVFRLIFVAKIFLIYAHGRLK